MDERIIISTTVYGSREPDCVTVYYNTRGQNQKKRVSIFLNHTFQLILTAIKSI